MYKRKKQVRQQDAYPTIRRPPPRINDSQLLPRVAVIERNLNRNRNETTKSYVCCLNIPIDFHASSVRSNLLLDTISLWGTGGRLVRLR